MTSTVNNNANLDRTSASQNVMSKTIALFNMAGAMFVLAVLFLLSSSWALPYDAKLQIISASAAFFYGWALIVLYKREGGIGFFWILLLISFPFYFGQQILGAVGLSTTRIMISIRQLSSETVWSASFFVMLSVLFLVAGYLMVRRDAKPRNVYCLDENAESLRSACMCLCVILLAPTVVYLANNILLTASLGYGARIDPLNASHGINNITGILAQLMPYSLLGLFITRRPGEKWQIVGLILYYSTYMMSGSRSSVFSAFPVYIFLWFNLFSNKGARSQIVIMGAAVLAVGAFFSIISFTRAFAATANFNDVGKLMAENNILVDMLQEAGQTFVATGALIERMPNNIGQTNGLTYLAGIVYIIPNALTGNYYASVPSVDELVAPYLTSYGGVGSSFIAEGFLNFGPWCLVLFILYGMLIARMSNAADREMHNGDIMLLFVVSSCYLAFAFYIRSDVRTFPRTFIWNILPIVVLQQIYNVWLVRKKKAQSNFRRNTVFAAKADKRRFCGDEVGDCIFASPQTEDKEVCSNDV